MQNKLRPAQVLCDVHSGIKPGGQFYLGDAVKQMEQLSRGEGRVQLVYIDPPFCTGKNWATYSDKWETRDGYLNYMHQALSLCRKMLTPDGSIYVHIDYRMHPYIRLMMDEIYGESNYRNEIIWSYQSGGRAMHHFSRKHDTILFYSNGPQPFFEPMQVGLPRQDNRKNHMRRGVDAQGRGYRTIRTGGKEYRYYDDTLVPPTDVWDDISHLQQRDSERTGYATQKPVKLVERAVRASSQPAAVVMDCFCGSGTTLDAAKRQGRAFVGIDNNPLSLLTVRKRLQGVGVTYHLPATDKRVPANVSVQAEGFGWRVQWLDEELPEYWAVGHRMGPTLRTQTASYAPESQRELTLLPDDGMPCLMVQKKREWTFYDIVSEE